MPRAILGKKNYLLFLEECYLTDEYKNKVIKNSIEVTNNINITPSHKSTNDLRNNFYFRLVTQDRFYSELIFPISVLKKLFYQEDKGKVFFDNWVNDMIDNIEFYTSNESIRFTEIDSLFIKESHIYIVTKNQDEQPLYSISKDNKREKILIKEDIRDLSLDHIEPLFKIIAELKDELKILNKIHRELISLNNNNRIRSRTELTSPGNILVQQNFLTKNEIEELKNELLKIGNRVNLRLISRRDNLQRNYEE